MVFVIFLSSKIRKAINEQEKRQIRSPVYLLKKFISVVQTTDLFFEAYYTDSEKRYFCRIRIVKKHKTIGMINRRCFHAR